MDCNLAGSSVHGILQARVLEWGAIAFSREKWWKDPKASRLKTPTVLTEALVACQRRNVYQLNVCLWPISRALKMVIFNTFAQFYMYLFFTDLFMVPKQEVPQYPPNPVFDTFIVSSFKNIYSLLLTYNNYLFFVLKVNTYSTFTLSLYVNVSSVWSIFCWVLMGQYSLSSCVTFNKFYFYNLHVKDWI